MPLAIYALAASTFAIGTTEFVIVGLIPGIADDLAVSLPAAGLLVSLYALAITVGTPVFSALTGRIPRRPLILALMVIFTACNLAAALAPNYHSLLAARIVMAVSHGVFFGVGAAVATSLVPKEKSGSAVALMMGGLTVAMVVGVPLGSWIGQSFDWRMPFFLVTAMGVMALGSLFLFVPRDIPPSPFTSFVAQMRLLGNKRLAMMYLLTAISFGGTFVIFTFLAAILTDITKVGDGTVNIALMLFGAATVVGNFAGGKLTDTIGTGKAMVATLIGLIVSFALIAIVMRSEIGILAVIAIWGIFAFAIPPIMQDGVVKVARLVAPDAVATASGMNIAAFNLGISSGSFVGGQSLVGPGLTATPYAAIAMAVAALGIASLANRMQTQTAPSLAR
ncbi:MFS transporter [Rhizobium sp. P32RR-XVIII]|uniref:MFS transporter n=1 Tax=Rhizobium sp. P32RR-XVIII TaxID=2726738 RepID=UPI0014574E9D|nr:MFS transporter [Rhizobium sp. P32RR-XVIII]NLS04087.1 MFS transporter [Rhizobium sp. P32RR-XVIII]